MKIAILGYDTEGKVSYDYFSAQGHELTICDQNSDLDVPDGATSVLGQSYLDNLDRFDLLVRTAGLPPHLILDKNPAVKDKITSHINEFFKASPTRNIIGVTGTKGKGTTSSLITEMLKAAGKDAYLGGNIGIPPLGFLDDLGAESWVVLELSSFQLIDLRYSPTIAVCLMIAPEHLDWHADAAEYYEAKRQLFVHQSTEDTAIYFSDNNTSHQIAEASPGHKIPYYASPGAVVEDGMVSIGRLAICDTSEIRLLGGHNWQNICAAVTAVWPVTQDVDACRSVITTFSGLPHRLELVRTLDGVSYYDDSFGTTPDTAIVALEAFPQPKVIILGGSDKGASYQGLAEAVAKTSVRKVLLIGEQAPQIQSALDTAHFTDYLPGGESIEEIVDKARHAAQTGDVVLLSTACASFDMFKNYKDRGERFKAAVQSLA